MKKKFDVEMMAWAEQGARLQLERIHAAFPKLRPAAPRPAEAAGSAPPAKRRRLSRAARKRISDAQKARWAKRRG